MSYFPSDYQQLVHEINNFIEAKMETSTVIDGKIIQVDMDRKKVKIDLNKNFNFNSGSVILVDHERGVVSQQWGKYIKVDFNDVSIFREGQKVTIDTSLMNIILERLESAVNLIESESLSDENKKVLDIILGKDQPVNRLRAVDFISKNLNDSQKDAIHRSVGADNFYLIIGPPGTGKTYVIQELIQHLVNSSQKVLITAWTNVAVDNILQRIIGVEESKIIKVGSSAGTSPVVKRFTISEKRKNHPYYPDVRVIEEAIKRGKKDKNELFSEIDYLNQKISELSQKRDNLNESFLQITKKRDTYKKLLDELDPGLMITDLREIEKEKLELEQKAALYFDLALKIEKFTEFEENLPEPDEFYNLETEIKKMKRDSVLRRATSPLNRKGYQKFTQKLDDKTSAQNKLTKLYNEYWNLKDQIESEYYQIYANDEHIPLDDALDTEFQLLKIFEKYLSLKKLEIQYELGNNRIDLVSGAYQSYLKVLNQEEEVLKTEVKSIKTQMYLEINKREAIKQEIKNIQDTLDLRAKQKRKLINEIDNDLLRESSVVVATIISAAHPVLDHYQFDTTLMDEASQVASYISLLPLLKSKKFILVGDDNQLQPIEESKLTPELNLSIFNHLISAYPEHNTFLDTQYRMNKKIADISSEMFYDGRLKTHPTVADQDIECEEEILNFNSPVTFLDTGSLAYEDGVGAGCQNGKEAHLVYDLTSLLLENGIKPQEIGVITPYKKHKEHINTLLDNHEIEVDTVYRFQGREKDVIIFSFCKSRIGPGSPYALRFVEKSTQLNVAITRARKKLIIIGNYKTLNRSPKIRKIIQLMGEENRLECVELGVEL